MQKQMQQIIDALKEQGINVSPADLETSRHLLIQFECEVNPIAIARLVVLRVQNPSWSDAELIEAHLNLKRERAAETNSYGAKLAESATDSIWQSLESSGLLEKVATNLRFKMADRILEIMSEPIDPTRQLVRENALKRTTDNYDFLSQKADQIIEAEYSESSDDLDAVINQAIGFSPTGENFRSALPASGGNHPKSKPELTLFCHSEEGKMKENSSNSTPDIWMKPVLRSRRSNVSMSIARHIETCLPK